MKMEHTMEFVLSIITTTATGIISFLVYRLKKHEEKREQEEERRKQEAVEAERRRQAEYDAFRASLLALTRDRILQGYRYYKRNGGISAQDLETMNKLYIAYHALGGNGTITAVHDKILELQLKEE